MMEMTNRDIIPACIKFMKQLAEEIRLKDKVDLEAKSEMKLLKKISEYLDNAYEALERLTVVSKEVKTIIDLKERALSYRNVVFKSMTDLRKNVDQLEKIVAKECWPFPSYCDILYSV